MKIKKTKTGRNFDLILFEDLYHVPCSIQKSSIATDDCIWIGCDEADPRNFVPITGWEKLKFPENTIFNTRMHLNRKQIKKLIPILQKFVDTGNIK